MSVSTSLKQASLQSLTLACVSEQLYLRGREDARGWPRQPLRSPILCMSSMRDVSSLFF